MNQPTRRRSPNSAPLTCQHPGCDREREARGWCPVHYNRWRDGRDMDAPIKSYRKRPAPPCKIEGCEATATAKGWCNRHYQRWWRLGDPGDANIPQYGLIKVCSADGCDLPHRTKGYCDRHYRRMRRGVPANSLNFTSVPTPNNPESYAAVHDRLRRTRGKASDLPCFWCGDRAHAWAYQHNDREALRSPGGHPYSLKLNQCYQPMCRSCHGQFDRDLDARIANL